jgi:hypothetical protein
MPGHDIHDPESVAGEARPTTAHACIFFNVHMIHGFSWLHARRQRFSAGNRRYITVTQLFQSNGCHLSKAKGRLVGAFSVIP